MKKILFFALISFVFSVPCLARGDAGQPSDSALAVETAVYEALDAPAVEAVGLPKALLLSVARAESALWPWTVYVDGKKLTFPDKAMAVTRAREAKDHGKPFSFGLFQLHGDLVDWQSLSIEEAMNMDVNARLAAEMIEALIKENGGNVRKGVGAYHSNDPLAASAYAERVLSEVVFIDERIRAMYAPNGDDLQPAQKAE